MIPRNVYGFIRRSSSKTWDIFFYVSPRIVSRNALQCAGFQCRFRLRDYTTMHTCTAQTEQIPNQIHLMDSPSYAVALPRVTNCDSSNSSNSNTGGGPNWNGKSIRPLRQCSQPARSVMIACRNAATLSHHQASSPALIFISAAPVKLGLGRSFPFSAPLVTLAFARGRKSTRPPDAQP